MIPPAMKPLRQQYLSGVRASQVAAIQARGVKVTIVSSGAVGAGLRELNLPKRPTDLAKLQAVAAVGQRRLMDAWDVAFKPHGLHVGQILLTRDDVDHRTRFLNLRNTIHAIHELGAVPIINENDTVSTDEIVKITFGDNDILAAGRICWFCSRWWMESSTRREIPCASWKASARRASWCESKNRHWEKAA
jgi:glutamate 5-kinase